MLGRFADELTLPDSGGFIEVRGPFRIDDDPNIDGSIGSAVIHFVIVQGQGDDAVTAHGIGHWERPAAEWTAQLPVKAGRLPDNTPGSFRTDVHDGMARGIGLAVAIKAGEVRNGTFEPPAFETLTWCARFRFVPGAARIASVTEQAVAT